MKAAFPATAACLGLLCGCAGPGRYPGAAHAAAPIATVDGPVPHEAPLLPADVPGREMIRLPDRITLPASYRLMLVEGHLALVRESDPQALEGSPASMRIVTGEIARGELAYQPGLLPQELAAEVASNRESAARMDNALETVMARSRELSEQALEIQAQSRKVAALLDAAQARLSELEAAGPAPPARPRPARTDPPTPQE